MPQSLARLHVHLIFSTKNRECLLPETIRADLHAYLAKLLLNRGYHPSAINSREDHIHILFDLARTIAMSKIVEEIKVASSKWLKTKGGEFAAFAWQSGYGVFAVSESNVLEVRHYIDHQEEHHRKRTFQEEYRAFLDRHGIAYDEKYVWD